MTDFAARPLAKAKRAFSPAATSSTFGPLSTCFGSPIICTSLCLLLLIRLSLSFVRSRTSSLADLG